MLGGKTYTWKLCRRENMGFFFFCGSLFGIFHWHIYTSFWVQTKIHTWIPKYSCANFRTSQKRGHEITQCHQCLVFSCNTRAWPALGKQAEYPVLSRKVLGITTPCGWPQLVLCEAERTRCVPDVPSDLSYSMVSWIWNYVNSLISSCPCNSVSTELQMFFSRCS